MQLSIKYRVTLIDDHERMAIIIADELGYDVGDSMTSNRMAIRRMFKDYGYVTILNRIYERCALTTPDIQEHHI